MNAYKYQMGVSEEDEAKLFPVVPSKIPKGNGHKLKYGKCHTNIRKTFFASRFVEQNMGAGCSERFTSFHP